MTDYTDEFEQKVWGPYPERNGKKTKKKPAYQKWQKLKRDEQLAVIADIGKRNRQQGWGKYIRDLVTYVPSATLATDTSGCLRSGSNAGFGMPATSNANESARMARR